MKPFKFPKPPTHQDFEELILAIVSRECRNTPDVTVELYGRNGQAQHGYDVVARSINGTFVGYQCKDTIALTKATIAEEVAKTEGHRTGLMRYVIYTTAARDTGAQDAAAEEAVLLKIPVEVRPWEEVERSLSTNHDIARKYMAALPMREEAEIYVGYLRVAFDRAAFTDTAEMEWSHREQREAIKDVVEFLATGQLQTREDGRDVIVTLPATTIRDLQTELKKLTALLNSLKAKVVPAAKAEVRYDYQFIVERRDGIDAARRKLMEFVNALLVDFGEEEVLVN